MNARAALLHLVLVASLSLCLPVRAQKPAGEPEQKLSVVTNITVREFRFDGNTVYSDEVLSKITAPYVNRAVTLDDLEEARRAITLQYVTNGYVNSGAVLPDQSVRDGIVTYQIKEGVLSEIVLEGENWLGPSNRIWRTHWLRESHLKGRIERYAGPPLNLNELKEGLQILRQNPNIRQINAELRPGVEPGQSSLDVRFKEHNPFRLSLQADNHRPPSVGGEEISVLAAHQNLTGHSDVLQLNYVIAHTEVNGSNKTFDFAGDDNIGGSYTLPVNRYDTTMSGFIRKDDYAVIEEPFDQLKIRSESAHYGFTIRHPIYRTANRELAASFTGEREESTGFLLGSKFSSSAGAEKGELNLTVLRFSQEWLDRSQQHVFAVRSTFNFGVDVFDVTDAKGQATTNTFPTARDADFFSWQGQVQYVRRLFDTPNQLILRTDMQWTPDPLLSPEQFSIGGANTVRGYRENTLVRDSGIVGSAEFRIPVWFDKAGNGIVQLAPFFDFGAGWNNGGDVDDRPTSIYSAGIGLLVTPIRHVNAQLYWGHRLQSLSNPHEDLQDEGIHFKITVEVF